VYAQKQPTFLLATLAALVIGCGGAAKDSASTTETPSVSGGAVSDFTLKDINGRTVTLSDYMHENVVLLSFWAPCCESGKQKTLDAQKLYETYSDQGLAILAITVDEPGRRGEVRTFCKQRNVAFPVLIDEESAVMDQLNPNRMLPFTIIIDKSGEIAWTHEGYVPGDEQLVEAELVKLLGESSS
jgi:peroxiredoxin